MEPTSVSPLGSQLRRYRRAAGLTQEELAARAGVGVRTISDIERGASRAPHQDTVALLAAALGLAVGARSTFADAAQRRRDARTGGRPASPVAGGAGMPPFVGRAPEMALIARHRAGEGPPVLVLAGEPGIGKSRLLAEAAPDAAANGWTVLAAGCQRREGQEPYAPLLGALKTYMGGQSPSRLRVDLHGCAWLVRLLPELADGPIEPLPEWALAPEQERRLMGDAVVRFLANVAGPAGTLLVLDDLQWAGSDALDLFAVLVRAASAVPVRILGAYRDTDVRMDDSLAVLLADLAHAALALHHTLAPLTPEESQELLDRLHNQGDVHAGAVSDRIVVERAGGVPFFVVSYAQGLQAAGADDGARTVPWSIAHSVRQRVAALPEAARTVLGTAAVNGRDTTVEALVAATGRSEEETLALLEAICQARLVIDQGDHYRIAHDVIREVVEGDLGAARRRTLHRRVAAAIEATMGHRPHAQYEALAYHFQQGEAWEKALEYRVKSGDKAAAANAVRDALAHYAEALALCERLGSAGHASAATVAEKRGFISFDCGDFPGAAREYGTMHEAALQAGDTHRAALAMIHRGRALNYGHAFAAAEQSVRAALDLAGETFDDIRLFGTVLLIEMLTLLNRHAEAAPLFPIAAALMARVDHPLSRARFADLEGFLHHWRGEYDAALASFARWRVAAEAVRHVNERIWLGWEEALVHGSMGNYDRALALLDEVITRCDRLGEVFVRARALNTKGWIYGELQDHERALQFNFESYECASVPTATDPEVVNNARLNLGDMLMAVGRHAEAEAHFRVVEETIRHPRPQDHLLLWRYAQHCCHSYGEWWLQRGDHGTARAYADECLERAEASDSKKNIVKARRLRAQVALADGALPTADEEIAHALRVARAIRNPPQLWQTHAVVGALRHRQGRPEEARSAYRDALAEIERVAAGLHDERLRTTFLHSSFVQGVRRLGTER